MLRLAVPSEREKRSLLNFLSRKGQKRKSVEIDATDYLMSSPIDREGLLKAMDDFQNDRGVFIQKDLIEL